MDALRVQRIDIQTEAECWDDALRTTVDAGARARRPRQAATTGGDGGAFTMLDLARSRDRARRSDADLSRAAVLDGRAPDPGRERRRRSRPSSRAARTSARRSTRATSTATSSASAATRATPRSPTATSPRSIATGRCRARPSSAVYGDAERRRVRARARGVPRRRLRRAAATRGRGAGAERCGTFAAPGAIGDDIAGVDAKLASVTGKRTTVYDARGRARPRVRQRCAARASPATPARSPIPTPRSPGSSRSRSPRTCGRRRPARRSRSRTTSRATRPRATCSYALANTFAKSGLLAQGAARRDRGERLLQSPAAPRRAAARRRTPIPTCSIRG